MPFSIMDLGPTYNAIHCNQMTILDDICVCITFRLYDFIDEFSSADAFFLPVHIAVALAFS